MSGVFSISVTEARGQIAIPAELDRLAIVIGATSAGSGMSGFFSSGAAAVTALGYGDAVDAVTQIIEQKQATGTAKKYPVACYSATTLDGMDGAYGTFHKVGAGATVASAHAGSKPYGTYEVVIKCVTGGEKAPANPWEGADTLEWTHLPSPAPYHSFETPPVVK